MLTISNEGVKLIEKFEGFRAKPYLCSANVATIGIGSTFYPNGKKVTMQDEPINYTKAIEILKFNLQGFILNVSKLITSNVTQNQFDAIVSFAYNCGVGALKKSTLLKKLNINPNDPTIEAEFKKWCKAGGKTIKGLLLRREEEAKLYFKK